METLRIQALAEYLEQVNMGKAVIFSVSGEDEFSKLEDEIYKTVTSLYHTKDSAVQAKNAFAENLSNIAHQIKTLITALSLSVQMMRQDLDVRYLEQMERQLLRLNRQEEALLLLFRMDAGTLLLQKQETDVYTLLVLAADHLEELLGRSQALIDIPEMEGRKIVVDLEWTMEAMMNLMKNCMEHHPGGTIHCACEQNPLYTEILIWDEGEGFAKEDLPHLFERLYRGQNACGGGIGIGLALARELIERQNGTIRAKNRSGGGACLEWTENGRRPGDIPDLRPQFLFCDGPDSCRKSGGAFDARIRHEDDGSCRSYLVQVGEHFHLQFSSVQHIPLAGKIAGFGGFRGSVRVQGFMTVGSGAALFIDIFQSIHRPAGKILSAVRVRAGESVHIRPFFGPVGPKGDESSVRNRTILCFVLLDIGGSDDISRVRLYLLGDVDDAEGEDQILDIISFG